MRPHLTSSGRHISLQGIRARKSLPCLAAVLGDLLCTAALAAEDETEKVRENVNAYVEAFNAHDAAKAASFWSEVGRYEGPEGVLIEGRDAIKSGYESLFESEPQIKIKVDILAIRQTSPSVILEQGTATLMQGEEPTRELIYKGTHVRTPEGWKLDHIDEMEVAAGGEHQEALEPLSFLVGNWVDDGGRFQIDMTCIWSKNRHSLLRKFEVVADGALVLEGTQVIAFDANKRQIKSWLFDSEGGIGEGTWRQVDDRWIVTTKQTQGDGAIAGGVNIITPMNEDVYFWQSTEREVDGQLLPDIPEVAIVRKSAIDRYKAEMAKESQDGSVAADSENIDSENTDSTESNPSEPEDE